MLWQILRSVSLQKWLITQKWLIVTFVWMWSFIILPQRWIPIIPLDPLTVLCIHPEAVPNVVLASLSANMLWDTKESICLWYISLPMPRITAVVGNLRREGNVAELNPVHLLVSFSHSLSVIKTTSLLFFSSLLSTQSCWSIASAATSAKIHHAQGSITGTGSVFLCTITQGTHSQT